MQLTLRLRRPDPMVCLWQCTSAVSAQRSVDRRERQSDGRNNEANPQEAHRRLHRSRDEDVTPTKTAGREDDRKARGFPKSKDGQKGTALENLKTAGAQQAHD